MRLERLMMRCRLFWATGRFTVRTITVEPQSQSQRCTSSPQFKFGPSRTRRACCTTAGTESCLAVTTSPRVCLLPQCHPQPPILLRNPPTARPKVRSHRALPTAQPPALLRAQQLLLPWLQLLARSQWNSSNYNTQHVSKPPVLRRSTSRLAPDRSSSSFH